MSPSETMTARPVVTDELETGASGQEGKGRVRVRVRVAGAYVHTWTAVGHSEHHRSQNE